MKSIHNFLFLVLFPLIVLVISACGDVDNPKLMQEYKSRLNIIEEPISFDPVLASITVTCRDGGTITCEGGSCSGDDFDDGSDGHCTCLHPFNAKVCGIERTEATITVTCKNGDEISCTGKNCSGADWDDGLNDNGDAWCACVEGDDYKNCGQNSGTSPD